MEKYGTAAQATIWCIAHRVTEYIILIALPLHQWLHKCASMLRITHNASLVLSYEDITPPPPPTHKVSWHGTGLLNCSQSLLDCEKSLHFTSL